ncbi:MAG: 4-alpha-glucanotransferase [Clostridiales Family XIII bacterium]|jgi:4-alpha-glucanotransferase|nr:4-alpha-glucanotransferase [Clostridiales Family XIII bacterium]
MNRLRRAGVLLPVFSLPSPYGIGTLGKAAFDFVDFLAASGQSLWQILPMGSTGASASPYQSVSAFAGNPFYVALDLLVADGLLMKRELKPLRDATAGASRVDYAVQKELRAPLLAKAAARFIPDAGYKKFRRDNAWWLEDFERCTTEAAASVIQYLFHHQWLNLKRYANARGVGIVGDLPFYLGSDSVDYKAHPELFATDAEGRPRLIAGVPPDAFAKDGQIWNDPVYDWKEHARTGYDWWIRRFRQADALYDLCRVDHFRAFAAYFAIPAGRPASDGKWTPGPGKKFIDAVKNSVPGLGVIAEDLGIITDDIHALREYSGYPGMRVMQFAFGPGDDSSYLPHNHIEDCVCYTGTHDNPTLVEWSSKLAKPEADFARAYLGADGKGLPEAVLKAALGSVARSVIIPLQDYLGLGARARINTPSTVSKKNWTWRLSPDSLTKELAGRIAELSRMYGRA